MNKYQRHLFEIRSDDKYRKFHQSLIPTVSPDLIIGMRTPAINQYAKELRKSGEYTEFISALPHKYYEENMLHVKILSLENDFGELITQTERMLPFIDNWAVCDGFNPKLFARRREELLPKVRVWIRSEHEYTRRYGIKMLMDHFLDEDFKPEYLDMAAGADDGRMYVSLMVAWYMATALAKQYDAAVRVIEEGKLEKKTHNKAIQKACESFRVPDERKAYLRTLRK